MIVNKTKQSNTNMKRLLILIILLTGLLASAQTQQGFVKTKGRMVNGQLVPGKGLKGAAVSVQGRTTVLVNSDDGAFSFPATNHQFRIDSVRKKGYQLVDMDACPRTYQYSGNPLYIVMETPEQQLQDKLTAERKIRRNLQKQLQEREDEIESLKEQQKISDEEYRQALQQLYADQESNEQLISDMAKRYSELDYDQLDEFYRQVSYCIENGQLVKADSLLNSRGNLSKQVEEQLQRGLVIQNKQEELDKAKAVYEADQEELAQRCYSYYETFAAQHLNDTAAYYLELRASLDTTNAEWIAQAGDFRYYMGDKESALSFYHKAVNTIKEQVGEKGLLCSIYNNMGVALTDLGRYEEAENCLNQALEIGKRQFEETHPEVSTTYNNLGSLSSALGDYETAFGYYGKALEIAKTVYSPDTPEIATIYANLGTLYFNFYEFDKTTEYISYALNIFLKAYGETDQRVGTCYDNLALLYLYTGDFDHALEYADKAIAVFKSLYGKKHPNLAISHGTKALILNDLGIYQEALQHTDTCIEMLKEVYGEEHPFLGAAYGNKGRIYEELDDYSQALAWHLKGLEITKNIYGGIHPEIATSYHNIAIDYTHLTEFKKALEYYRRELEIMEAVFGDNPPDIDKTYNNMGFCHFQLKEYSEAVVCYSKAFEIRKATLGEDHPVTLETQERLKTAEDALSKANR